MEVIVRLDTWTKVRDAAGDLSWVEKKALSDTRTLVVTAPLADVRVGLTLATTFLGLTGIFTVVTAMVIVVNILTDILYAWIDPRVVYD